MNCHICASYSHMTGILTAARLALIRANAQVLAAGLAIIGVLAPEEMR